MDLIDRQEAIDALERSKKIYFDRQVIIGAMKDIVRNLPSAQPEIIRCRDCKHYYFADNRIPQEQRYVCDIGGEVWQPDDYCSFAERR